jgi:hypothetical protein
MIPEGGRFQVGVSGALGPERDSVAVAFELAFVRPDGADPVIELRYLATLDQPLAGASLPRAVVARVVEATWPYFRGLAAQSLAALGLPVPDLPFNAPSELSAEHGRDRFHLDNPE